MPDKYIVFHDAKNALLSYYQTQQTNQIARLLGLSVVLFALIQILQSANRISALFPIISSLISGAFPNSGWVEIIRLILLLFGMVMIFAVMIYSLGRFSLYSQFNRFLIDMQYEDMDNPLGRISDAIWTKIKGGNTKLLWTIPLKWFASMREEIGSKKDMNRKGWRLSFVLGALLALVVTLVFWWWKPT